MIYFDPFYLLLLIFLLNLLPGVILSLSILKNKKLFFIEKLFIGFAIGLVIPPLFPFILSLIEIPYSYSIALYSVVLFYLIALYFAYKNKPWENYRNSLNFSINRNRILSLALLLVLLLSFWIRMQSYSPIFFDLDPYFYLYSSTQIITMGIPPLDDQTAWYPEVVVDHRNVPALSYLESMWYSFYTSGGAYDNYMLSLVASFYPPIMAMLAMFFLYLFVSSVYKREFGIISAAVAMSVPMLIIKLAASEFEMQAYGFFAMSFFFALYALSIKEQDSIYPLLASLALVALYLGSGTIVLIVTALIVFIPLHSLLIFFKRDKKELFAFIKINSIIFVGLLISTILLGMYKGSISFSHFQYLPLAAILFSGALYLIKEKIQDMNKIYGYSIALLVISLIVLAVTPLGGMFLGIIKSGLGAAEYQSALYRTIQEQGIAGPDLSGSLGFMGQQFEDPISYLFVVFTSISNLLIRIPIEIGNNLFGASLPFSEKVNSPLMVIIFFSIIALLSSFYRSTKGAYTLSILFFAVIFPTSFIGLLKSKFTIYTGFLLSAAFGIVLGEAMVIAPSILKRIENLKKEAKDYSKLTLNVLLAIGILFSLFQFSYDDFSTSILLSSFQTRFQDDPTALQEKFQELCNHMIQYGHRDAALVCAAASDPIAFASSGINYQYNQQLCMYSLSEEKDITNFELRAVGFRCLRINDYWMDTMEWIKDNPDEDMRVTSWWDYGHWINYFGEKNTVLRNEHASSFMIGEVAHNYLTGTPEELKEFMISHDSEYALFDSELLSFGQGLGGKYGALNYLSCARNNLTDVSKSYMESECEWDQLWETIYVPTVQTYYQECTISPLTGQTGMVVFTQEYGFDSSGAVTASASPSYCFGETTLADGSKVDALYYLDKKHENGDLKLNKARLLYAASDESFDIYHLLYFKDNIWVENGEIKSGWEDRKGQFYDSNLYSAYFLEELEGFELVYTSNFGEVKIYKIKD